MVSVEVQGLTKRFGDIVAVDDIDFTVNHGEFATLVGPSGCGKTTTLRCIAGLERPAEGVIKAGDTTLTDLNRGVFVPPQKRNIGFIFQTFDVWPHLTVFENVAYPLRVQDYTKAEIEEKVNEYLELTNIQDLKSKNATDLSGGQQARVSICRALVSDPDILLCDEPLTGLDRNLRKRLRVEIRRIQSEVGITTIYVTHSQPEAMELSDRIFLMNTNGKIEQSGSADDIYATPVSEYAFDFFGASEILPGKISRNGSVETEIGMIDCAVEGFEDTEEVHVAFRPQNVHISHEKEGETNTYEGEVDRISFLGDLYEIDLSINGKYVLGRAQHLPPHLAEGDSVYIHIDPDDIHLFRSAPPAPVQA